MIGLPRKRKRRWLSSHEAKRPATTLARGVFITEGIVDPQHIIRRVLDESNASGVGAISEPRGWDA